MKKDAIKSLESILEVSLGEVLDQQFDLSLCAEKSYSGIVFDFKNVRNINTTGLRTFVDFVKSIPLHKQILYRNCNVDVVHVLNMIPALARRTNVRIESFALPYLCEDCHLSHEVYTKASAFVEIKLVECPDCGKAMKFDDVPQAYFYFLGKEF